MENHAPRPRGAAINDDASRREYRVRFDGNGRILGHTVDSELSRDLQIGVDSDTDDTIFKYVQHFAHLDRSLPMRLETRLLTLVQGHEEFSVTGDVFLDEEPHHLRISGQAIRNLDGRMSFTLLILDDTEPTRRRRLYEYMFRLANHELNGPLSAIIGAVDFAQEHVQTGNLEGIGYCLEMISRNAEVIDEMIQRYLNLSRIESGLIAISPVDMLISKTVLEPMLAQMEPFLSKKSMSVQFECRGCDHEPKVHADPEKVEIVLRNLLSNAIKYGTAYTPIQVYLRPTGEDAEITVENQGPTIPEDQLNKLFERFVRLEATQGAKGSGLGLYNARKVVELWGGRISVTSDRDATRFTFTLPLAKEEINK